MTDSLNGPELDGPELDGPELDGPELGIFVAAVRGAATTRTGAALDASLDEIGWFDALALAPRAAVGTLFETQGAACGASGALGRLILFALDVPRDGVEVVLPPFGTAAPPAQRTHGRTEVRVRGLAGAGLGRTEAVLLVAAGPGGHAVSATAPTATLSQRAVRGLDPTLGLVEVEATVDLDPDSWGPVGGSWDDAVALARLAVGHELVGTMRTMLELAREHALDRVQFGRPIAGFQAVRHRLAEALVAVEAASAALDGAWSDRSPTTAAIAKAACGHGAATVRRHCQQVLAGIGFTTEHDLHRYVRRSIVLDGVMGDARSLIAQLGAEVLAQRALPRVLPL